MLLKTERSGVRRRVVAAAAGFSGSIAGCCLGVAAASGQRGPLCGFLAAAIAMAALGRAALRRGPEPAPLRLCPRSGALTEDGDGDALLVPIGVTRGLICLARPGGRGQRPIWRDSVAPDAFRRIAAFGIWRRGAANYSVDGTELIRPKAVTEGRSIPGTRRSRDGP